MKKCLRLACTLPVTSKGGTPGAMELTDADGDMIYEAIESFEADSGSTITFKFINGNAWTDVNELIGEDCGDGTGNRTLTLDSENMTCCFRKRCRRRVLLQRLFFLHPAFGGDVHN